MALRTPFLCNFQHFSVSINSFYGNKDYKLAGNYVSQVERIEISIMRGLISLQFHLFLLMMDRDTKLIAILRRKYHIILTGLGENIFRIGLRLFATPPNTEHIFSQLAVCIMWYCRLKIAISLY